VRPLLILLWLTVATGAASLLAVLRPRRGGRTHTRAVLNIAIAASLLVVLIVTIPKAPWGGHSPPRRIFPVPFQELIKELREDDPALGPVIGEMFVNVLLFLPMGLLVPLRWPRWADIKRILAAAAVLSLGIESVQFALGWGRTSSATDILLNTAGAGVGYLLLVVWRRRRSPPVVQPPRRRA
jgi:glycopeptide antibiotics resistance protein